MQDVDPRVLYERTTGVNISTARVNGSGWLEVRCPTPEHEDRKGSCSLHSESGFWKCYRCDIRGWPLDLVVAAGQAADPDEALTWINDSGIRGITYDQRHKLGSLPRTFKRLSALSRDLIEERLVARYTYRDEQLRPLKQVLRYEGWSLGADGEQVWDKRVVQRGWDSVSKGWVWSTDVARNVPYRLPELIAAARGGETIFIVEGEKCVECLRALDLNATTFSGGANADPEEADWEFFQGAKHVVILADSDDVGREAAARWERMFKERGFAAESIDLDPLGSGGFDVHDWTKERYYWTPERLKEGLRDELRALRMDRELSATDTREIDPLEIAL